MSAQRGNLPRPATPGPWYSAESLEVPLVLTKRDSTLVCTVHPYAASPDVWGADDDAIAIAALPEWIAARDAEREGRLRAEAALAELERDARDALATHVGLSSLHGGVRLQARTTLTIIHRRGFGGGS